MAARKKVEQRVIPCQYGCGRVAEGSLNVSFSTFDEAPTNYRDGFNVYIPACRQCLKGAVKVMVNVPREAST